MTENLKVQRIGAGLTQRQLAERIGCAQSEISRIERGERCVSIGRLRELAETLDVPVLVLLDDGQIDP